MFIPIDVCQKAKGEKATGYLYLSLLKLSTHFPLGGTHNQLPRIRCWFVWWMAENSTPSWVVHKISNIPPLLTWLKTACNHVGIIIVILLRMLDKLYTNIHAKMCWWPILDFWLKYKHTYRYSLFTIVYSCCIQTTHKSYFTIRMHKSH